MDINQPKLQYTRAVNEVKKVVVCHNHKVSLTHVEADLLETSPAMDLCQTGLLPKVVITTITIEANVNLSFI